MLKGLASFLIAGLLASSSYADTATVTFTQLPGTTAVLTGVYAANLSNLGLSTIESITIQDNSGGLGGSPGQFSGFDLDAIILSNTNFTTAATAGSRFGPAGIRLLHNGHLLYPRQPTAAHRFQAFWDRRDWHSR